MKDKILFIDDEQANLDGFYYSFNGIYNITLANSAYEAIEIIKKEKFKVIISDQRMAGMTGIEFLSGYKESFHDAILIILTAFSESHDLIEAINTVGIFRYIMKPWDHHDLKITISSAVSAYNLKENNTNLLSELELKNKELSVALEHAKESDRLKSTFINNISHEIRTPMNGIMGFIEIAKMSNKKPEEILKYLDIIYELSQRLFGIIDDILDFSLLINNDLKFIYSHVNLNNLLQDLYIKYQKQCHEKLYLKLIAPEEEMICYLDEMKIIKILSKLLDNAVKYTVSGEISFGCFRNPDVTDTITFFVKDTGIGIAQNMLEKIFDPFTKEEPEADTLNEGNGLGLAISKKIIENMSGHIRVESIKNKGTVFYVILPV